jgi:CRP-like cAMP-binding protein
MLNKILDFLQHDEDSNKRFTSMFIEKKIASKTTLLKEGDVAQNLFFIKEGCLRLWFNNEGKDITLQFFFENQAVSSIDSFLNGEPGKFTLESIEPSTIVSISKDDFNTLNTRYPALKEGFQELIYKRMSNYALLFLSRIKDNPAKRYEELIKNNPEIIRRVPQHYIASYLGITSISLSRIRNRK